MVYAIILYPHLMFVSELRKDTPTMKLTRTSRRRGGRSNANQHGHNYNTWIVPIIVIPPPPSSSQTTNRNNNRRRQRRRSRRRDRQRRTSRTTTTNTTNVDGASNGGGDEDRGATSVGVPTSTNEQGGLQSLQMNNNSDDNESDLEQFGNDQVNHSSNANVVVGRTNINDNGKEEDDDDDSAVQPPSFMNILGVVLKDGHWLSC